MELPKLMDFYCAPRTEKKSDDSPMKGPPSPVILLVPLQRGDMAFLCHVGFDLIALCHGVHLRALVYMNLMLHPVVILDRVELAALFHQGAFDRVLGDSFP